MKKLFLIGTALFCIATTGLAEDPEHLGALGTGAFRQKDYDQAIKYFSEAIQVNSNYVGAYYFRGLSYLATTQYDNAIADLSRALALNTNDPEAYYFRGLCYLDKKRYDKVAADMSSALLLRTNAPYLLSRAYAYLQMTNYNGAIEDYTRLIRLNPVSTEAYLARAQAYDMEKVYGLAMLDCRTVLLINPELPAAYQEQGEIYHDEGDFTNAIADYDTLLQLAPDDKSGYYLRAMTYNDMGDSSNAVSDLNTYLKFNPDDSEAYNYRGSCRSDLGDYAGALSDCQRAIALDPESMWGYNNLAWLMAVCPDARYRNGKKALEYAKKACALGGWQDPSCVDTLAAAYAEAGDFRDAVKWEKRAMKNIPSEHLAECHKALHCYEQGLPYRELPK